MSASSYWKCKYDELITFYPRFYREVFEMDAILRSEGALADGINNGIVQVCANNFILSADEETIEKWESLLDLTSDSELTLDQRKAVVIASMLGYGHFGEAEIRAIISKYTDEAVTVDFAEGIVYISIVGNVFDEASLLSTLLRHIPAHLAINMTICITRTFRQQLDFRYGAAVGAVFTTLPTQLVTSSTSEVGPSKGVYCYTNVKSKLIG